MNKDADDADEAETTSDAATLALRISEDAVSLLKVNSERLRLQIFNDAYIVYDSSLKLKDSLSSSSSSNSMKDICLAAVCESDKVLFNEAEAEARLLRDNMLTAIDIDDIDDKDLLKQKGESGTNIIIECEEVSNSEQIDKKKSISAIETKESPKIRSAMHGFLVHGRLAKREEFTPREVLSKIIKAEEVFVEDPDIVHKKKRRREMKDEAKRLAEEAEAVALRNRQLDALERTGRPWGLPHITIMPNSSSSSFAAVTSNISPSRVTLGEADSVLPFSDPYLLQQWPQSLKKRTASFGIRPPSMRKRGRYILLWLASPKGLYIKKGGNAAVNLAAWMAVEKNLPLVAIITLPKTITKEKSNIESFLMESAQGQWLVEAKVPLLMLHTESNSGASDALIALLMDLTLHSRANREDESGQEHIPVFAHCLIVDEPTSFSDLAVLEDLINKAMPTTTASATAAASFAPSSLPQSSLLSDVKLPPIFVSNGTCVIPSRQVKLDDTIQTNNGEIERVKEIFSKLLSSALDSNQPSSEYFQTLYPVLLHQGDDFHKFCLAILSKVNPETPIVQRDLSSDLPSQATFISVVNQLEKLGMSTKSLAWEIKIAEISECNRTDDVHFDNVIFNQLSTEGPSDEFNVFLALFISAISLKPNSDTAMRLARFIISLLLRDWRSYLMYATFSSARKIELQRLKSSGAIHLSRPDPDGEWLHKLFHGIYLCQLLHSLPPPPSVSSVSLIPCRFNELLKYKSGDILFDAALKEWVLGDERRFIKRKQELIEKIDIAKLELKKEGEEDLKSMNETSIAEVTSSEIITTLKECEMSESAISNAMQAIPRDLLVAFIAGRLAQWSSLLQGSKSQALEEEKLAFSFNIAVATLIGENNERELPRNELSNAELVFDIARALKGVKTLC